LPAPEPNPSQPVTEGRDLERRAARPRWSSTDISGGPILAPGARSLAIVDLVQRYDIGRHATARGALSRLVSRGLIVGHRTTAAFRVADISREDLLDITLMRTAVENGGGPAGNQPWRTDALGGPAS